MRVNFGGEKNFDLEIDQVLKRGFRNIVFFVDRELTKPILLIVGNDFKTLFFGILYIRDIHYKIKLANIIKKLISVEILDLDLWIFEKALSDSIIEDDTWSIFCKIPMPGALLKIRDTRMEINIKSEICWSNSLFKLKWMKHFYVSFTSVEVFRFVKERLYKEVVSVDLEKFYSIEKDIGYDWFTFLVIIVSNIILIILIKNLLSIKGFSGVIEKWQNFSKHRLRGG